MGLFSKKKTYVGTSFTSLVEDVDNIMGKYTVNLMMADQPLVEGLMDNYMSGLASKTRAYYKYGESGKYTRGLPEGTLNYTIPNQVAVKEAIESEVGQPVLMQTAVVEKCDTDYLVLDYLMQNHGLDPETLIVHNPPSEIPDNERPVLYVDHTPKGSDIISIEYEYSVYDNQDREWQSRTMALDTYIPYSANALYVHAVYSVGGVEYYWSYQVGSGTYPELDKTKSHKLTSKYYPIVPVRERNSTVEGELYDSSKKILNRLDIDIDDLIEGVEENPDVDDVDHAYFLIAANLQSDKEMTQQYLHNYFKYLSEQSLFTKIHYLQWLASPYGNPPMNEVVISDGELDITINYLYADVETEDKVIGDVGAIQRTNTVLPRESAGGSGSSLFYSKSFYEVSEFILEKQISATQVERVVVKGLLHRNDVYKGHMVETSLADSLSEDENNFIIPLNYDVVTEMGIVDATQLMQDCLLMVFQSYQVVKLKWYQTGFFKFVAMVIAVAVIIYTGMDIYTTLLTATSYSAAALTIAEYVIYALVAQITFKFVVENVGIEIALILSAILAGYAAYSVSTSTTSVDGLPYATEVLQVSNGLMDATGQVVQDELTGVYDEMEALQEDYEAFQEELDLINEDLAGKDVLNPYLFIQPTETPDVYLARTIHSGNIGVRSLDFVPNYVDLSLDLTLI